LPPPLPDPAVDPAVGPAGHVRGMVVRGGRDHDDVRPARVDGDASQVPDVETVHRSLPRPAAVRALVVAVSRGGAQRFGPVGMDRQLVGVVRTAWDAIAPGAPAVRRRHERARFDRDPEPAGLVWVAGDPAYVVRLRPRRKGPFG